MPESWILGGSLVVAVVAAASAITVGARVSTQRRLISDLTARVENLEAGGVMPQLHPTAIIRKSTEAGSLVTVTIANDGTTAARGLVIKRALVSILGKDGRARATTLVEGDSGTVATIEPGEATGIALRALPADTLKTRPGERLVVTRVEGTYFHVLDASGTTATQTYVYEDEAAENTYALPDVESWQPRNTGSVWENFWESMK